MQPERFRDTPQDETFLREVVAAGDQELFVADDAGEVCGFALAQDLATNTRYISAVVNNRFHKNYTELVNGYRVEEAMSLMVDRRYQKTNIEDISAMVGFSNRQSFYAAFYRFVGKTPRQYRVEELEKRAIDTTPKKRGRKPKNRQEGNA